jgi:hypothetical protein
MVKVCAVAAEDPSPVSASARKTRMQREGEGCVKPPHKPSHVRDYYEKKEIATNCEKKTNFTRMLLLLRH